MKFVFSLSLIILFTQARSRDSTFKFEFNKASIVFRIMLPKTHSTGTAFAAAYNGKYYLITAAHVVSGYANGEDVEILMDRGIDTTTHILKIYRSSVLNFADIAVIPINLKRMTDEQLSIIPVLRNTIEVKIGSEVYFMGYPSVALFAGETPINVAVSGKTAGGKNPPIIKFGRISSIFESNANNTSLIIDAQSMPGFSGSPVFGYDYLSQSMTVVGVVTSGIKSNIIYLEKGVEKTAGDMYYLTSLSHVALIRHATQIIEENNL